MNNFLTASFWFNPSPGFFIPSTSKIILGTILLFIIISIICAILQKRRDFYSPLWKKLFAFFVAQAIVGAFLFFFNRELIPFLAARVWFAIWFLEIIIWAIFIIIYARKLPAKKKQFETEKEFKKYIP